MRNVRWLGILSLIAFVFCLLHGITAPTQALEPYGKSLLLYDPAVTEAERIETFQSSLRKVGFRTVTVARTLTALEEGLAEGFDVVLLVIDRASVFPTASFMRNTIRPYVEDGGLVIISSTRNLPVDEWFGFSAGLEVWESDLDHRQTVWTDGRRWVREPHDIRSEIESRHAPMYSYKELANEWEVMAKRKSPLGEDGEPAPYLLRAKVGSGVLFATTSGIGLTKGYEVFGHYRPDNAAKLIDNLLWSHDG